MASQDSLNKIVQTQITPQDMSEYRYAADTKYN